MPLLKLSVRSWFSWIFVTLVFLFLLWLFFGGKKYDYIGLNPILDDGEIVMDSPVKNYSMFANKIKSPYIMSEVVEDVLEEQEHPVNCVPYVPNGIIKSIQTNGNLSKKRMDSKGEQLCRDILEKHYKKPFPKIRPGFIRNPETQTLLELDGYNSELGIAFEYNGVQHYTWPNFTNQTYDEFKSQVRRDQFKLECCDRHNVYLITVPYTVPFDDLKDYIIHYLPENVSKRLKDNSDKSRKNS